MDTFKSSWQPCQLYIMSHICLHCVCVGMCIRLDTNSSALNGLVVGNYLPPTHIWTPTYTQWFPSSGHAVICQPWSLWVAHGGVEAASRSDLCPGFTTGSRQFIPYLPTMPHSVGMMWWAWWTGGWGWMARYRSRNSPETKRLFFAAAEEMCMCGLFTQTGQRASAASLCLSWWFRFVLRCRKCSETTVIPDWYCHQSDFDFELHFVTFL